MITSEKFNIALQVARMAEKGTLGPLSERTAEQIIEALIEEGLDYYATLVANIVSKRELTAEEEKRLDLNKRQIEEEYYSSAIFCNMLN
ncbi:MAG: hypothetical protein PHY30_02180 [Candidatus Pacebacteria bacterium]|nr:hypothetical protein [Candidatus Paceibacterota bacterium]